MSRSENHVLTAQTSEIWYLVSYGINGMIGCFASVDTNIEYERGLEVLIQTDRGEEKGVILRSAISQEYRHLHASAATGQILSRYYPELEHREHADRLQQYFDEARQIIHSLFLPVQVVDIEQLLQPPAIVLHIVQFGPLDDVGLLAELKRRWNVPVQLMNLTDQDSLADEPGGSCGSGHGCSNCGSGSCGSEGCGQGSCQSHSSSQEPFQHTWQNYLAERRSQVVTGSSPP